jgi:hypothetical protein
MGIQIQGNSSTLAEVDPYKLSLRVSQVARGASYTVSGMSGQLTAALGANSSFFAMRMDPSAGASYKAYIDKIRLEWTTTIAFTTPITAGRRLALFRGSGAAASSGTALVPVKKDTSDGNTQFLSAEGGDIRISNTGILTVTGITYEADPLRVASLTHAGSAGAFREVIWEFDPGSASGAVVLRQGELIAIRNPIAMDAVGQWQIAVTVDWHEGTI